MTPLPTATSNKTNPNSNPNSNLNSNPNDKNNHTPNHTQNQLSDEKAKLLIRNSWSSISNPDDHKTNDNPQKARGRVHNAADQIILQNRDGFLKTVCGNFNKKTYCYKMITEEGIKYFVKIFEDSTMSPTKVAKELWKKSTQNILDKQELEKYILLPSFKPQKTRLDAHTYQVVIYPYLKHLNLEDLTLKALKQGYINPEYHRGREGSKPHAPGYKYRMLKTFEQCVTIAIQLKGDNYGYIDMDIRCFCVDPCTKLISSDLCNTIQS